MTVTYVSPCRLVVAYKASRHTTQDVDHTLQICLCGRVIPDQKACYLMRMLTDLAVHNAEFLEPVHLGFRSTISSFASVIRVGSVKYVRVQRDFCSHSVIGTIA